MIPITYLLLFHRHIPRIEIRVCESAFVRLRGHQNLLPTTSSVPEDGHLLAKPRNSFRGILVIFLLACLSQAQAAPTKPIVFQRAFAPSEGGVKAPEAAYRQEICLNGSWRFQPIPVPTEYKPNQGDAPTLPPPAPGRWEKTALKVPSPWNVNAFNRDDGGDFRCYPSYPQAWDTVEMGWLERSFRVPAAWKGKRLLLHFEAVAGDAVVSVNGKTVAHNFDLFLPFEADVTEAVRVGGVNTVQVGIRKASLFNDTRTTGSRPYPAGSFWGQSIAGIWQDVFLDALPAVHAWDTYVKSEVSQNTLTAEVALHNDTPRAQTIQVGGTVQPWVNLAGKDVLSAPEPKWMLGAAVLNLPPRSVTLAPGASATLTLYQKVGGKLALWTPDTPRLYGLTVAVSRDGQTIDKQFTRFGWREWKFSGNRHLLNGKPFELRGDSWHFLGIPQMTRRYAWSWFTMLHAAHANAVRLHAQPYPSFYLNVADELGICVLDETANWGSDGQHKYDSPDFWRRCDDQVARLVERDRNHPAVFGWSVSNEVAWFIDRGRHPEQIARLKQGWADWRGIADHLDPTRPWVSTDGDGDAEGAMPTAVGHYSGDDELTRLSRAGKPWGIGETGGAYFATPPYAAQFVGPRAYESQRGRMEGIAIEAYELIAAQRKAGADYGCVFNLAWYGLEPLELGLRDTSRPYTRTDGVFFGNYRENTPGVQPERLGPYASTFNPGYDPRLPLYRPWPLFDAVRAANAPGGPAPSPWDHRQKAAARLPQPPPHQSATVDVFAAPGSEVPAMLGALGVFLGQSETSDFLVIDGAHPPQDTLSRQALAQRVQNGATALVWGVDPSALPALNAILPMQLILTDRTASSLLVQATDPLLSGLNNADFYFTESQSTPLITHGLSGPFVTQGRTLLAACPAEWRRWNNRAEPVKTAALVRSEREAKPPGAALVELKTGQGRYLISSFVPTSRERRKLWKRILLNAGVPLTERKPPPDQAFDEFGHLVQALVCGSFGALSAAAAYDIDNIGIAPTLLPKPGDKSSGLEWRVKPADEDGVLDFRKMGLPGPAENAAVYLSFWVWSPRPLDNLLVEPNLPKLALRFGSDDGSQVWLNSKRIQEDRGTHPYTADSFIADALPLGQGWNHFVVKVVQGTGEWQFGARLTCSDPSFLSQLRTSVVGP